MVGQEELTILSPTTNLAVKFPVLLGDKTQPYKANLDTGELLELPDSNSLYIPVPPIRVTCTVPP
jgi:hypothetical protein